MVEILTGAMRRKLLDGNVLNTLPTALKKPKAWSRETPTTSIYFTDVMADLISDSLLSDAPLIRLEPNVFTTRGPRPVTIVFRYASDKMLRRFSSTFGARILYVIDDDVSSVEQDTYLPADYRGRMIEFRNRTVLPLSRLASEILAPSEVIFNTFPDKPGTLIAPANVHPFVGLGHHDRVDGAFDIVFGGTRSHVADLSMISLSLCEMLRVRPDIRLTTFLGKHAPKSLLGTNIRHIAPMTWPDYREFVARNRFHISILPALDTPFNRARSQSRILDNAAFGAASIYSARAPFSNWVSDGHNGLLVGDNPQEWCEKITQMADNRVHTRVIAERGIDLARRVGDRERLRHFWLEKLGIAAGLRVDEDSARSARNA